MTRNPRSDAVGVLRRFVRGEAGAGELEELARFLGVERTDEICTKLGLSAEDLSEMGLGWQGLARRLSLHISGRASREATLEWVEHLRRIVTSPCCEGSRALSPALATTLRLLALLLDSSIPSPLFKVRGALRKVLDCLEGEDAPPIRAYMPFILRDMGRLRLRVLESPLVSTWPWRDGFDRVMGPGAAWLDVGLSSGRGADVRLIPLSIFTRDFFYRAMPEILASMDEPGERERARTDRFYYHPENDQALSLKEKFPRLRDCPLGFQYFIDEAGLAEIVLDTQSLGAPQTVFAAKLFCLQNGIRRATLDGRRLACKAVSLP